MIEIARLVPHAGAMVLLERVDQWDAQGVACRTRSHLDPANPLRRDGRLAAVCGVEYGLQAAALHGALLADGARPQPGYVASLRDVRLAVDRLDDPVFRELVVEARLHAQEAFGMVYSIELRAGDAVLLAARVAIALPR